MSANTLPDIFSRLRKFGAPRFGAVFIGSFMIVAAKNGLDGVFFPLLYSEDAGNIFKNFYYRNEWQNIFTVYASYIRVFPYLIGYLLGFLPLQIILPLYCLISICMTALAYSIFYPVLNHFFNDRRFSAYSVLAISALPLANFQLTEVLMFQIWHSVVILFLLALLPVPNNPWPRAGFTLAAHLMIWTHPYSIMALPLFFWQMASRQEHRWTQAGFVASAILYYLIAVERQPMHFGSIEFLIPNLLARVVCESLIGPNNRVHLQYLEGINILAVLMLITVAATLFLAWKKWHAEQKWFLAVCLYLILIPMAAALVSRDLGEYYHLLRGSPRYVYIPKLFFTVILLVTAREIFIRSAWLHQLRWALAILLLFVNSNSNVLYNTNRNMDRENLRFMRQLQSGTVPCGPREEKIIYLDRGQWVLPINLCRH